MPEYLWPLAPSRSSCAKANSNLGHDCMSPRQAFSKSVNAGYCRYKIHFSSLNDTKLLSIWHIRGLNIHSTGLQCFQPSLHAARAATCFKGRYCSLACFSQPFQDFIKRHKIEAWPARCHDVVALEVTVMIPPGAAGAQSSPKDLPSHIFDAFPCRYMGHCKTVEAAFNDGRSALLWYLVAPHADVVREISLKMVNGIEGRNMEAIFLSTSWCSRSDQVLTSLSHALNWTCAVSVHVANP